MKITDLIIDPRSLGSKLWLVEVSPGGSASAAFPIRGQYYPLWETCSM